MRTHGAAFSVAVLKDMDYAVSDGSGLPPQRSLTQPGGFLVDRELGRLVESYDA